MLNRNRSLIAGAVVLALATVAEAGPPLICHPFAAGTAPLLPWSPGQGWNTPDRNYDVHNLTADTMRLLTPEAPVLARMENLRRATIYAASDREVAAELMAAVLKRSQAPEGARDPLAQFDAGYLIESYRQASYIYKWDMLNGSERRRWALRTEPANVDGYALVTKAISLVGNSPEMEFAASLMKEGPLASEHRRKAMAGAKAGSLLARNLAN
jgi:hypothetical protein